MPRIAVAVDVIRHALQGRVLSQVGDSLLRVDLSAPSRLGRFSVAAETGVSIQVINRADDKDEAGIVGGDAAHIPFDPASAWIRYGLTAKTSGRLRIATTTSNGGQDVRLHAYHRHSPLEGAVRAMRRDLDSFRSIMQLEDVRRLKPGEALSIEVSGSFTTAVEHAWSDVVGSRLTSILDALDLPIPVVVRLGRAAAASVHARVRDRYTIVISRREDGAFRFTWKKAASADQRAGIELGAFVDASLVQAIEAAVDPLLEAVTGEAIENLRRIVDSASPGSLTGEDREVIERIVRRLGLGSAAAQEQAVLAAVERLRKALRRELEKALRWKAEVGLTYEYSRIAETSAVVDYVLLDPDILPGDHAAVMKGNLEALRTSLRSGSKRQLLRWLNETSLERTTAYGFSLGIGKWISASARERATSRITRRTSIEGLQRITFHGFRRYEEKGIPQNDFEWTVDLKAETREFRRQPVTTDLELGLHYAITLERRNLHAADLARMIDFAAMWGVQVADATVLGEALGRSAVLRLQLLFEHDDLRALLQAASSPDWSGNLAAAMPYLSTFEERRDHARRRSVYGDAWRRWLRGDEHSHDEWASLLENRIQSGLRVFERQGLPGSFVWTSGEGHPHLRARLEEFERGLSRLNEILTHGEAPETIQAVHASLEGLWTQRLYVAASGLHLLEQAQAVGVRVNRSLQVEFDETTLTV